MHTILLHMSYFTYIFFTNHKIICKSKHLLQGHTLLFHIQGFVLDYFIDCCYKYNYFFKYGLVQSIKEDLIKILELFIIMGLNSLILVVHIGYDFFL